MAKTTRLKGKRFRAPVADGHPLWEVVRSRGRGVFECRVVDEPIEIDGKTYPSDYAGITDVFTREQIEQMLRLEAWRGESQAMHEEFYASLGDHQIVHYHDSFGQFIRCHVVTAGEPDELDHPCIEKGMRCLKQVALVGNWEAHALRPDSYHVKRMGRLFKPNASCIYENPKAPCRKKQADPRFMKPVDLSEAVA